MPTPRSRRLATALALLLLPGCGSARDEPVVDEKPAHSGAEKPSRSNEVAPAEVALKAITVPSTNAASTPNLTRAPDGRVLMTWQEETDGGARVRWRERDPSGAWGAAHTLAESDRLFVNWADFPMMAQTGPGARVATWLERHEDGTGYGIRWAHGGGEGSPWSRAAQLPEDSQGPEYGFVSMALRRDGSLQAYWLDGRNARAEGHAQMQLRTAVLDAKGEVSGRRLVDEKVCDCCQTSAAATPDGPVVVYRDRNEDEIRDVRLEGPTPGAFRTVGLDGWKIEGCPVNGPSVSATDSGELVVAWFTAAGGRPKVNAAFASNTGPFASALRVDLGNPVGRVAVTWLDNRRAAVIFVEHPAEKGGDAELILRVVERGGSLGEPHPLAPVTAAPASGFPRLARAGEDLVIAYTEATADPPQVRVAELNLGTLP